MSKNYLRDWEDGRDIDEPIVAPIPKNVKKLSDAPVIRNKTDFGKRREQKERERWGEN